MDNYRTDITAEGDNVLRLAMADRGNNRKVTHWLVRPADSAAAA